MLSIGKFKLDISLYKFEYSRISGIQRKYQALLNECQSIVWLSIWINIELEPTLIFNQESSIDSLLGKLYLNLFWAYDVLLEC